tara:strand:- start:2649 stop:3353 length:705 start_codon:yes stop_codon:yes gene_type:complete
MTKPVEKQKSRPRPGSPSNKRLIDGNLRTDEAFQAYLDNNFSTVNQLRKRKGKKANSKKKNKRNVKIKHNARISMQAIHGFGAVPAQKQKKLKMEGGGDNQYYMPADEQTGSAQGNLNASLNEQKGRNQGGGGSVPTGFIPPAGMSGNDVASLKSTADITEQGKASAVGDGDIPQKPCGENAAIGGRRRKKRRTKKKRKRRKSRRKSRRKKRRTRRRRKNLKLLRFSKMPPKYL